jgi:hypothetical protein
MGSTTSKGATKSSTSPVGAMAVAAPKTDDSLASSSMADKNVATSTLVATDSNGGGGCPMHQKDGSYSFDPFAAWKAGFPHVPTGSKPLDGAAVAGAAGANPQQPPHHTEYNVYGQRIDPANQMPTQPHQQPAPGQQIPLSTARVPSTIPKVGIRRYRSNAFAATPTEQFLALSSCDVLM